jgi:hypothetical protein
MNLITNITPLIQIKRTVLCSEANQLCWIFAFNSSVHICSADFPKRLAEKKGVD